MSQSKTLYEVDDTLYYNVSNSNSGSTDQPNAIMADVLPYSGDARGSRFDGALNLKSLTVTVTGDSQDTANNSNLKVVYTTDPAVRNTNSAQGIGWAAANGWTAAGTITAGESKTFEINAAATAWAVIGSEATNIGLASHEYYTVDVALAPSGNKGGNKYVNNVSSFGGTAGQSSDIVTPNVTLLVAERRLSGHVWAEDDRNGLYAAGEPLVSGVTATLYDANGGVVTNLKNSKCEVQTDANGYYEFRYLPEGSFHVVFTSGKSDISGFTVVPKHAGDAAIDSDGTGIYAANALTEADTDAYTLEAFNPSKTDAVYAAENIDLGLAVKREISGRAWLDANNDGKRADGEALIPGLQAALLTANGAAATDVYGKAVAPVVTGADGSYKFTDLAPGSYQVVFTGTDAVVLDHLQASPVQAKGVAADLNSDAVGTASQDILTKTTISDLSLATIAEVFADKNAIVKLENEDSGLFAERKLSGLVFVDFNRDGKRAANDDILEEITVELLHKDGTAVTDVFGSKVPAQITEIGGGYQFEHLADGDYVVKFTGKNNRWMSWTEFKATTIQAAGVPADVNSDAAANYDKDAKLKDTTLGTSLPLLESKNGPLYNQKNLDSGLIAPVEITKTANYDDGAVIAEGKSIQYTITIRCPAYETKNLVFSDVIPSGMTWLPDTLDVDMAQVGTIKVNNVNYNRATGAVTFPALNFLKGTSTITFTCAIDALPSGTDFVVAKNTAKLTPKEDGKPYESNTTTHYIVSRHATIDKTAALVLDDGSYDAENRGTPENAVRAELTQTVEYRLKVTNVANVPAGYESKVVSGDLVITDAIPKDTAYVEKSAAVRFAAGSKAKTVSAGIENGGLKWVINGLAANETATLVFQVKAPVTSDDPATDTYETTKVFTNTAKLLDKELAERVYETTYTRYDKNGAVVGTYTKGQTIHSEQEYALTSQTTYHKVCEPLLTRTKTSDPASPAANGLVPVVKAGEPITYHIAVKNVGDAPAYNTQIKDTVPTGTTLKTVADGGSQDNGGTILWNLGAVAVGETRTVSFTVVVNDHENTPAVLRNVAYTSNTKTPGGKDPNPDPDPWKPTPEVDHQVYGWIKVSDPMGGSGESDAVLLRQGQAVTYTMQLSADEAMSNVVVTDPVPDGMTVVPGSISVILPDGATSAIPDSAYNASNRTITWPERNVTAGVTGFRFQTVVDKLDGGSYARYFSNIATVKGNRGNGDPFEEKTNPITHKVYSGDADLHKSAQVVAKDGSLAEINNGKADAPVYTELQQAVQYTLTATYKTAKDHASGDLIVTDALPGGTSYVDGSLAVDTAGTSATVTSATVQNIAGLDGKETAGIRVVLNGLKDGDAVKIAFRVKAPITSDDPATAAYETTKVFTNTAKLLDVDKSKLVYENDTPDHKANTPVYPPDAYDKTSETTYHVVKEPLVSISKSSDPATGKQISSKGAKIAYTLTVANDGDGDAYNVVVTDRIPQFTSYIKDSAKGAGANVTSGLQMVQGSQAIVFVTDKIAAHSSITLTFQVQADAYTDVGTRTIANVAQVRVTPTTPGTHDPAIDPSVLPQLPDKDWKQSNEVKHTQHNDPDNGLLIHKIDTDTKQSLAGAEFQILFCLKAECFRWPALYRNRRRE